jgi:hypothetical protein
VAIDRPAADRAGHSARTLADRNTCSHVYRQSMLPAILARLPAHCALMQAVAARLNAADD